MSSPVPHPPLLSTTSSSAPTRPSPSTGIWAPHSSVTMPKKEVKTIISSNANLLPTNTPLLHNDLRSPQPSTQLFSNSFRQTPMDMLKALMFQRAAYATVAATTNAMNFRSSGGWRQQYLQRIPSTYPPLPYSFLNPLQYPYSPAPSSVISPPLPPPLLNLSPLPEVSSLKPLFTVRNLGTPSGKPIKKGNNGVLQSVIYNGERPLQPGEFLKIPSEITSVCQRTNKPQEANFSANSNRVLKQIDKGEEVILLALSMDTISPIHPEMSKPTSSSTKSIDDPLKSQHLRNWKRKSHPPVHREKTREFQGTSHSSINSHILDEEGENISTEISENVLGSKKVEVEEEEHRQQQHHSSSGYRCERCGKMFTYAYYRDKHLKYTRCVDNGDRKFPCPLCSRSFEKRDRLRIHVLHVHENHRPHVCTVCSKAFSQSSSLNKHLRVHSGERPYHCPFCTKSFTASSILRTHVRQHSGEKPFKCAFCGKSFASHAAHDSHVRRTHAVMDAHPPDVSLQHPSTSSFCQQREVGKSDQDDSISSREANSLRCNLCEKPFENHSQLRFHFNFIHDGVGDIS